MKGIKRIVLFIFVMGLFELTLFPLITSRIEGVVRDFDTGAVIIGAEVRLYPFSPPTSSNPKTKTYNDGRFRFDDLRQGEYYISVYKEGYEIYGPCPEELKQDTNVPLYFEGTIASIPKSVRGRIYLKEGEIKHFKISLRKEAVVEVLFSKKTEKGETPLVPRDSSGEVDLRKRTYAATIYLIEIENYLSNSEFLIKPPIVEAGKLIFNNLSGEQKIKVDYGTFHDPPLSSNEVYLRSGETTTIHHVLDFTTGMVVHGFISPKNPDKPFFIEKITLKGSGFSVLGIIEEHREFWLKGMQEGKCLLKVELVKSVDSRWIEIRDEIVLDVKKDERIELALEY